MDSITVFVYAVIGGLGSVPGVLIGIFVFEYLQSITALGSLHLVISSVVALWVLSAFPGGLGQVVYNLRDRLLRMVADRRGLVVPSLVADKRQGGAGPSEQEDLLAAMVGGGDGDGHTGDGTGGEAAVQPVGAVAGTISLEADR
ncbi:MAG TPA: hypothetical protein VK428_14695 [Acidimicrobiales bacterium]|nr:hypothetical protein [Acidimicrobiales bacterium]